MTYWHIIRCTSGQEGRAERYLEQMGYPHGWHPTDKKRLSEAVYARLLRSWNNLPKFAKSNKPKRYTTVPYVYGYVFVPTDEIDVHRVNGHHPRVWMGVLCVDGAPYRLTDAQMAEMKSVPARVKELLDEAERAEREAWEAKRPVPGQQGRVVQGPFEGVTADVDCVTAEGEVKFKGTGLLAALTIPQEHVERVA